ncbi:MAG TPA: VWA domain-containing protein [Candidatus Saccharicenans sp.]|nr:VWA domain-containing protein [Candidatus Saccharicenans sp.]HOJ25597.1 VWA domain-containing protein [Candidatus Saccharicenans sp.]HOL46459.1 VWA domain-containing protein [Candidatus Saccharicenans sp.]HPP23148.1 VWA domain-containing protein [Candidatus Saccharicenans sp.]HQM74175.1 VWA domain-containing protein [Candidatus Saccharicenans sp.]
MSARNRRSRSLIVIILVALLAVGVFVSLLPNMGQGQEKVRDNQQYQVSVIRKLIYVMVTDDKGQPVTDLSKEDFILYDNGKEKLLTEFENHTMSLPAEKKGPEPVVENKPEEKVPAPQPLLNRIFLYLFDLVFTDQGGFKLAREAALRSLEKELEPDMLVGVLTFSGGRVLNVLHQPDRDREGARRAIESIQAKDIMPLAPSRFEDNGFKMAVSRSADEAYSRPVFGFSQRSSDLMEGRIVASNFIWAMQSLAQALRYVQGKKIILLYSNGIHPVYLGRGAYVDNGNAHLGQEYEQLCRQLADANASVFPVDTEDNTYFIIPEARKGVHSLQEMASKTGGQYTGTIYAAPNHIEKIETLTAAYYVLGYPVPESWDGKYHEIKVKVKRPGCRVIFQPGYFNQKPFSSFSELEKKIHLVDVALSPKPLSGEPVRFAMEAQVKSPAPPNNIQIIARLQVEELGEVVGPRVEAVSLLFDQLDQIVDSRRIELDLTRPEYRQKPLSIQSELSAKPGTYKCRLVIRNMETGKSAVSAASVTIPGPDKN